MPTQYTKSRLVLGAYNQIDISDLDFNPVTKSVNEYVEKAIEISNNKNLYDLKQDIKKRAKKIYMKEKRLFLILKKLLKRLLIN